MPGEVIPAYARGEVIPERALADVIPAQAGIQVFLVQHGEARIYGLREKNKDVIFLRNEPEKLFRINKTHLKKCKNEPENRPQAPKYRFAKLFEMNHLTFCWKKRTGTNRKNEPEPCATSRRERTLFRTDSLTEMTIVIWFSPARLGGA
jgi:hypothetical protein